MTKRIGRLAVLAALLGAAATAQPAQAAICVTEDGPCVTGVEENVDAAVKYVEESFPPDLREGICTPAVWVFTPICVRET